MRWVALILGLVNLGMAIAIPTYTIQTWICLFFGVWGVVLFLTSSSEIKPEPVNEERAKRERHRLHQQFPGPWTK